MTLNTRTVGFLFSRLRRGVLAVAIVAGLASGASAAPITTDHTYSLDLTKAGQKVATFDTTLGTLQSIDLTLNYYLAVVNPYFGDASRAGQSCFAHAQGLEISLGTTNAPNLIHNATEFDAHTVTGPCSSPTLDIIKETQASVAPSLFGDFLSAGPGEVNFFIHDLAPWLLTVSVQNPGGFLETYGLMGAAVTVSYTYAPTPVPEPATMAMLAFGCAGILARRRYQR